MRTFVVWRERDARQELAVATVADRVATLLDPLLAVAPAVHTLDATHASAVFAEQPVRGWRRSFLEEGAGTWALAAEYPFGAEGLAALARRFGNDAEPLLATLQPPFALVWSDEQGAVHVHNDALGQAQLFTYDDGRVFAVTNRLIALRALGVTLEPLVEDWAVRTVLGWFPRDRSGYRNVRFARPATRFTFGPGGVQQRSLDVLRSWVQPEPMSRASCLELARVSLERAIESVAPLWERPSLGVSGGWDTRAVVATMRRLGVAFSARVRGAPERPDVIVADELARSAGFQLRVRMEAGLPPEDPEACRRSITRALRWQSGYMVASKHKTFLSRHAGLDGGVVNVMGQHGEIGRAYYAHKIHASTLPEDAWEEALLESLVSRGAELVRPELREHVRETVRAAYRQADRYELTGRARLDFFYLHERTRRWASGSLNSQDGLVFAPFLNPDYVRAVFAYRGDTSDNPFHRHIVSVHAPEWTAVPYASDVAKQRPAAPRTARDWRQPRGNHHYDAMLYWQTVGAPLVDEALAAGGWWTRVFDESAASAGWPHPPDELVIAHLLPEALA